MSEERSKKDVSYLPRSWGQRSGRSKSGKSRPRSPEHSSADLDGSRGVAIADEAISHLSKEQCIQEQVSSKDSSQSDISTPDGPCGCERSESASGPCYGINSGLCAILPGSSCPNTSEVSGQKSEGAKSKVLLTICGVRFGYAGRIYHFEATDIELQQGDWVIVKTEKGAGLGHVAIPPYEREMDLAQCEGLRKVLRKAGRIDFNQKERCVQKEKEAHDFCLDRITELTLPMKLVAVECFFDASKYVFYFTAEGRVDFRELVKDLVSRFPVRIEMRQIGVRHEAKMIGGLACCGQELCCSRFLTDFRPVSVKMAKNQNLSLNPSKISGVCGRLMCCLSYEHNTYEEFKKGLPKIGRTVRTSKGEGVVLKHNPLAETVFVRLSEESIIEVTRDEVLTELELSTRTSLEIMEESDQSQEESMEIVDPEEV